MLRIEIETNNTNDGEAYIHDVQLDTSKIEIMAAIDTLYGGEGVLSIYMYVVEEIETTAL